MMESFIGCTIRQLPESERIVAANSAIKLNPSNRPSITRLSNLLESIFASLPQETPFVQPQHLALMTSKRWPASGVKLSVQFLDSPPTSVRNKILAMGNAWGEFCNVKCMETNGQGQVRIARVPGSGYWSYLGTDILHIPGNQQTMNLDSFTDRTPESEVIRVGKHEWGHTWGMPHEHMRQEVINLLDPEKVIAEFMRTQGWSRQEVIAQILSPLREGTFTGSASADLHSIMCYMLGANLTKNGQAIPGGKDFTETDRKTAATFYPLVVEPPAPPPIEPPKPPVKPPIEGDSVFAKILALIAAVRAKDWATVLKILLELISTTAPAGAGAAPNNQDAELAKVEEALKEAQAKAGC